MEWYGEDNYDCSNVYSISVILITISMKYLIIMRLFQQNWKFSQKFDFRAFWSFLPMMFPLAKIFKFNIFRLSGVYA